MSKRKRSIDRLVQNKAAPEKTAPRKSAADSFSNVLARLGNGTPNNLLAATSYPLTRLSRDYNLMNSLYRTSWIIKKIINTIPDDMVKNWITITATLSPEEQDRVDKVVRKTKLEEKLTEAMYWARLYGGAAAVMLIEGQEDILEEPLEIDDIGPNTFKGLMVVDRWSGIYPSTEIITDIADPDFGLPKYYEVRNNTTNSIMAKVHHSRVIRVIGRKLPFWENQAEMQWGASEIEHVFDELAKRDNTSWNIAALIFQANLLVDKVEGLNQVNAIGDTEDQTEFYNIKSAQNQMRNNNGMMIIGENEDVSALQYTFSGLNDIYESFMLDIAGAAEIPVVKLFGRSPAGLNSTGESDLQMYYDMIAQKQKTTLMPILEKVYPIIFMSEFGKLPKDLGFKFNPVKTPSDSEMADLVSKKEAAITDAYDHNLLTQKAAVTELHELSYTTNMFSSISDKNIADASDDYIGDGMEGFDLGAERTDPATPPGESSSSEPPQDKTKKPPVEKK